MDRIIEITEEIDIVDKGIEDEIFNASMEKYWTKVQELYTKNKFVHKSKLTKSEDTALHLAISSYHPDQDDSLQHPHLNCIKKMIASIPEVNRLGILKQKNEKGNTPLHLAAELGIVSIIECLVNPEDPALIRETNSKGETPLFIAAYQGKLQAFLYLHECVQDENREGPTELCRRKDGDNILHAAISREHFGINIDELKLMTYEAEGKGDLKLKLGFQRIKKLEERKKKHTWGVQIMKLMIKKEERYEFYSSTGEEPEDRDHHSQDLAPPTEPPLIDEDVNKKEEDQSKTAVSEQAPTSSTDKKQKDDPKSELSKPTKETQSKQTKETPLLVASRMGIVEMVHKIIKKFPVAIRDTDSEKKNLLLLAVEHRQTEVYNWLIGEKYPEHVFCQVDKEGNNAMHLAAKFQKLDVWRIPGSALQVQGERKWYKYVLHTLPHSYAHSYAYNEKGQTPREVYIETHAKLLKDGTKWLHKIGNSYSVVAALFTTVAFATAATIPGGPDEFGHPRFQNQPVFDVFCISSLVSLCFSVMALVFFLAILTSKCEHDDFEKDLPRKLLIALTSLFVSVSAILVSFCAAHSFVLGDKFKNKAFLIYGATCIPVVFLAFNQFPLYVDLICTSKKLPSRNYKDDPNW
ncbi:uncharacterized protein LOC132604403 isoform X2 [Lycium barbarum]|uniref:uncharacterized protein LOC132604403 isoform X2 n=1 Tax=Lycium barbarum TaxID=112863 RepID=UPI00293E89C1|nr:uncharacterized protein LOC132604403 isoform X2 [Lycium barbarum]